MFFAMEGAMKRVFLLLSLLVVAACDDGGREPVRIGINPWPGYEFLFLAREKGFFEREGVAVDLVELESLGDVRRAYERGRVDGMATTMIEVIQTFARSEHEPRVVLAADFSDGADVIIARDDVDGPGGLKGRKVAAEPASLGMFVLARALDQAGLSLDDVTVVPMGQSHMMNAFAKKEIDAAVTYPPFSVGLSKVEDAKTIFDTSAIPGEVVDVVSLDRAMIEARPDAVAALVRAWDAAVAFARANPIEANAIMAKRIGVTVEEFAESLEGIRVLSVAEQAKYMRPGGAVDKSAKHVEALLLGIGQIDKPVLSSPVAHREAVLGGAGR